MTSFKEQILTIHSWERLVGATTTVFFTTLTDSVWLVPLCVQASNPAIGIAHATTYALSYTFLMTVTSISTILLYDATTHSTGAEDGGTKYNWVSSLIGATSCWTIAAFFFYKAWQKDRYVQLQQSEQSYLEVTALNHNNNNINNTVSSPDNDEEQPPSLDDDNILIADQSNEMTTTEYTCQDDMVDDDENDEANPISTLHIGTVISLTLLGSLDEVSYFPGLILGGVFSPIELIIGASLAMTIVLSILFFFMNPCKPVFKFIKNVPIYLIISVYASILTLEVIWDIVRD